MYLPLSSPRSTHTYSTPSQLQGFFSENSPSHLICAAHIYLWAWGQPLGYGECTRSYPFEKTDSPFLRSHQLSISPQLELRAR